MNFSYLSFVLLFSVALFSSLSVAYLGYASVVASFFAAVSLGWARKLRGEREFSHSANALFFGALGTVGWLCSTAWLATGVHSMNQSYWWTGYVVGGIAALIGGVPFTILSLPLLRVRSSDSALITMIRNAAAAASFSACVHLWPHPFTGSAAIGLLNSQFLSQLASIGGMPVLLFALHWIGFTAGGALRVNGEPRATGYVAGSIGVAVVASAAWFGWGWYAISSINREIEGASTLVVGVVQPNIQIEGSVPLGKPGSKESLYEQTAELLRRSPPVDIVVWPEIPLYFSPSNNPLDSTKLSELLSGVTTPLLVNADMYTNETVFGRVPFYNAEQLFIGSGSVQQEYRKHLLIPVGEYMPLEQYFATPETERFLSGLRRYVPGNALTLFSVPTRSDEVVRVGTPICLELLSSRHAHRMVAAGAEVLVSPANDLYFRSETAARLGIAFARVRAIENRRSVVRVTNSGLSVVVGPTGSIAPSDVLPPFAPAAAVYTVSLLENKTTLLAAEDRGILLLVVPILALFLIERRYGKQDGEGVLPRSRGT